MKEAAANTMRVSKKKADGKRINQDPQHNKGKEKGKAKTKHIEHNATTKTKQAGHAIETQ